MYKIWIYKKLSFVVFKIGSIILFTRLYSFYITRLYVTAKYAWSKDIIDTINEEVIVVITYQFNKHFRKTHF